MLYNVVLAAWITPLLSDASRFFLFVSPAPDEVPNFAWQEPKPDQGTLGSNTPKGTSEPWTILNPPNRTKEFRLTILYHFHAHGNAEICSWVVFFRGNAILLLQSCQMASTGTGTEEVSADPGSPPHRWMSPSVGFVLSRLVSIDEFYILIKPYKTYWPKTCSRSAATSKYKLELEYNLCKSCIHIKSGCLMLKEPFLRRKMMQSNCKSNAWGLPSLFSRTAKHTSEMGQKTFILHL